MGVKKAEVVQTGPIGVQKRKACRAQKAWSSKGECAQSKRVEASYAVVPDSAPGKLNSGPSYDVGHRTASRHLGGHQ